MVCFEPAKDDDNGVHSPIMIDPYNGCFPPNTLYRLKRVIAAGEWEAAGTGVYPRQRLLVVTATWRPPTAGLLSADRGGGKLCGAAVNLSYSRREAFVRGLDDLIAKPALSMANEFAASLLWTDWKGAEYSLKHEWAYVNGAATRLAGCTPGIRDDRNHGKRPEAFLAEVNEYILERRKGVWSGTMLPEEHALLTLDEVLAVRLYTGPAYQPVNEFLRQIASLTGEFRVALNQLAGLTFAATVGHLCRAIRKLAAIATPEEAGRPLYRGVRGELPRAFWVPDEQGLVCAVDMAFVSTSRIRQTPIDYMKGGGEPNVLWALQPGEESDSGFHCGASVELLSQFASEAEVIFPPCTLLKVKEKTSSRLRRVAQASTPRKAGPRVAPAEEDYQVEAASEGGKTFQSIVVTPTFL